MNLELRGGVLVDRVLFDGRARSRSTHLSPRGYRRGRSDRQCWCHPFTCDAIGRRARRRPPVGANLKDYAATPGFEIALNSAGRMPSPNAPVFSSMLRYTSCLADSGPK